MTSDEKRKVCGADVVGGWRMYCHDLYGRSATGITVVLVGTGVVNIDNAGDFHDGPVHRCMRSDICAGLFQGGMGIRMQNIPAFDRVYATNQDDNFLIFD